MRYYGNDVTGQENFFTDDVITRIFIAFLTGKSKTLNVEIPARICAHAQIDQCTSIRMICIKLNKVKRFARSGNFKKWNFMPSCTICVVHFIDTVILQ